MKRDRYNILTLQDIPNIMIVDKRKFRYSLNSKDTLSPRALAFFRNFFNLSNYTKRFFFTVFALIIHHFQGLSFAYGVHPSLSMLQITLTQCCGSAVIRLTSRSFKNINTLDHLKALHIMLLILQLKVALIVCVFLHHDNVCFCLLSTNINLGTSRNCPGQRLKD